MLTTCWRLSEKNINFAYRFSDFADFFTIKNN